MLTPLLDLIAEALMTYAPAYLANMAPPVAGALCLPGGSPISATRIGTGKTHRGLLSGIAAGLLGGFTLQSIDLGWYGDQTALTAILTGGLMGLGAMFGDITESAIKRRMKLPPGHPWVPWDQIDFILGATVPALLFMPMRWEVFLTALMITPPLHLLVNVASYLLGIKKVWW